VPYAELDDGPLALMKNAGLPVALYGQLTFEHSEFLDKSGMATFPNDTCPPSAVISAVARPQGRSRIVARSHEGVLPDPGDSYRCAIRWTVRFGVRHGHNSQRILMRWAILILALPWGHLDAVYKSAAELPCPGWPRPTLLGFEPFAG